MKWSNNLKNIYDTGKVGKCPFCGSANTDYTATVVLKDKKMGFMDIWCNDCKKAHHASRLEVEDYFDTGKPIPKNLKYTI
ncbi:MAG: hypothetical protein Q4B70_09395 [Lachnospiraceae bacterium]|nr:hypothetical protein [Lachnospiraceae bacterium]